MKPGDLARLVDVGIVSGQIVLILQVRPVLPKSSIMVADFIYTGGLVEGYSIDFFEPVQQPVPCGMM